MGSLNEPVATKHRSLHKFDFSKTFHFWTLETNNRWKFWQPWKINLYWKFVLGSEQQQTSLSSPASDRFSSPAENDNSLKLLPYFLTYKSSIARKVWKILRGNNKSDVFSKDINNETNVNDDNKKVATVLIIALCQNRSNGRFFSN